MATLFAAVVLLLCFTLLAYWVAEQAVVVYLAAVTLTGRSPFGPATTELVVWLAAVMARLGEILP